MITMGVIYFILKLFGSESTLVFASTATRGDQNCNLRGINRRRRYRWRIWGIVKDRSSRSGTRD